MHPILKPGLLTIALVVALAACSREEASAPAAAPAASAPAQAPASAMPHPTPTEASASVDLTGIAKAEGGHTVAEVFAARTELQGKVVVIRGKVVKVNAGIMDRNWVHIRDGSGHEGTNDLTVTSTGAVPAIGDTVLVVGTLGLDRDFGMGYQYPVILEDAEVTVESAAL